MQEIVFKLSRFASPEIRYFPWYYPTNKVEESVGSLDSWICSEYEIDIPERFKPSTYLFGQLFGQVRITIDGKEYALEDVLGADRDGNAAIVRYDDNLKCKRSVSVKMTLKYPSSLH